MLNQQLEPKKVMGAMIVICVAAAALTSNWCYPAPRTIRPTIPPFVTTMRLYIVGCTSWTGID